MYFHGLSDYQYENARTLYYSYRRTHGQDLVYFSKASYNAPVKPYPPRPRPIIYRAPWIQKWSPCWHKLPLEIVEMILLHLASNGFPYWRHAALVCRRVSLRVLKLRFRLRKIHFRRLNDIQQLLSSIQFGSNPNNLRPSLSSLRVDLTSYVQPGLERQQDAFSAIASMKIDAARVELINFLTAFAKAPCALPTTLFPTTKHLYWREYGAIPHEYERINVTLQPVLFPNVEIIDIDIFHYASYLKTSIQFLFPALKKMTVSIIEASSDQIIRQHIPDFCRFMKYNIVADQARIILNVRVDDAYLAKTYHIPIVKSILSK